MHIITPTSEKIFKTSFVILVFSLLASPLGYFTRILYSRTLSTEMYGLFYSILAFITIFATYNDLGFGYAVTYLVPKFVKNKQYQKVWEAYYIDQVIETVSATLLAILLVILAPWLASHYFHSTQAIIPIYLFSVYLISISFLSALENFFLGLQLEKYYSSINLVKQFLILVLSFFSIKFFSSALLSFTLSWVISAILTSLIYHFLLLRQKRYQTSFSLNVPLTKKMWKYALPTLMASSLSIMLNSLETSLLTLFSGLEAVAIYNIALPAVMIASIFLTPINNLLFPLISEISDQKYLVKKLFDFVITFIPIASSYILLFLALYPEEIVGVLFGYKWSGRTSISIRILVAGYIITHTSSYISQFVSGLGLVNKRLKYMTYYTIIQIVLAVILIKYYGVIGAALDFLIGSIMRLGLNIWMVKQEVNIQIPVIYTVKFFLMILLVIVVQLILPDASTLLQILFKGMFYSAIFIISVFLSRLITFDQIRSVYYMSRKRQ